MVELLWGTRASPLWSGLWPCSCVQQSLPLCGVNRVSPHGPVSTRQASLAVLIEPVGRRLLPYTPWRYCRSIRPKHWETCTRVGTTWRFYMSCVLRRTSRSERRRWPHEGDSGSCDVHACGPGAPSLAVSHWHEGAGEGTVPECSRVTDRPFRRRCRELCPAVFGSTEADWGD